MRLTAKLTIVIHLSLLLSALFLLNSCGNNKEATAGSKITINPSSVTAAISTDTNFNFNVSVTYADGTPYSKAVLYIEGPFAQPRNNTNTNPRYQFYYYPGGTENSSNLAVNSPFTAQTDDYGNYQFSILVYGQVGGVTNSFKDTINVYSGSAFVTATVSIN